MILFLISVAKSDWRSKKATIQKKGQSYVLWKKNAKIGNSFNKLLQYWFIELDKTSV